MQLSLLTREEFLSWLGGRPAASSEPFEAAGSTLPRIAPGSLALFSDNNDVTDARTHYVVCVPPAELHDFFAFASTYVGTFAPFSAFHRVLTPEAFIAHAARAARPSSTPDSIMGVAMAEAYAHARGRVALKDLTISAVLSTLSSVLATGLRRGFSAEELPQLTSGWMRARQGQPEDSLVLSTAQIQEAWQVISLAFSPEPLVVTKREPASRIALFVREIAQGGDVETQALQSLLKSTIGVDGFAVKMKGTREERIKTLGDLLPAIAQSTQSELLRDFLSGTVLSMVGGGSFDFLPLTDRFREIAPGAVIWFGLIASLQRGTDVLSTAECLGRRVARDAFTPFDIFDPPTDDIAIDEFDILRKSRKEGQGFRSGHLSVISIEIAPGVSVKIRSGSSSRSDGGRSDLESQRRLGADIEQLRELKYLLDRARHTVDRIAGEQDDLFNTRTRQSRPRK